MNLPAEILRTLFACLVLLGMCGAQAGGLYKWTDKDGNVVFSDKPPPAEEAAPDKVEGYTPITVKQAIEQEQKAAAERRAKAREKARIAAELEQAKTQTGTDNLEPGKERLTCAQAKARLKIQSRGYKNMYAPNADGTFTRLDENAAAGLKAAWQAVVDRACAGEKAAGASAEGSSGG